MSIAVLCKVCGNSHPAEQFKLHHDYRQMVCGGCFSGKTGPKKVERKQEVKKPVGWDSEDEYLEKFSKLRKEENQAQFTRIPGTDNVKCRCAACKYSFKYNPYKKTPSICPYCNTDIPKLKTFNLL
jgi:hypothetical protein